MSKRVIETVFSSSGVSQLPVDDIVNLKDTLSTRLKDLLKLDTDGLNRNAIGAIGKVIGLDGVVSAVSPIAEAIQKELRTLGGLTDYNLQTVLEGGINKTQLTRGDTSVEVSGISGRDTQGILGKMGAPVQVQDKSLLSILGGGLLSKSAETGQYSAMNGFLTSLFGDEAAKGFNSNALPAFVSGGQTEAAFAAASSLDYGQRQTSSPDYAKSILTNVPTGQNVSPGLLANVLGGQNGGVVDSSNLATASRSAKASAAETSPLTAAIFAGLDFIA